MIYDINEEVQLSIHDNGGYWKGYARAIFKGHTKTGRIRVLISAGVANSIASAKRCFGKKAKFFDDEQTRSYDPCMIKKMN